MTTLRIDIKGIMQRIGASTAYALAQRAKITLPTVYRYANHPETVKMVDVTILSRIAAEIAKSRGVDVLDVTLGEIFTVE